MWKTNDPCNGALYNTQTKKLQSKELNNLEMDRKPYRTLGEGSSSLLKTSFLSACKDGSGMRFLLCRGGEG
jgi:hypothetical protein